MGLLKRKFHFTLESEMKYLTTPPSLRTVNISPVSIIGQNWLRSFVARTSDRAGKWPAGRLRERGYGGLAAFPGPACRFV